MSKKDGEIEYLDDGAPSNGDFIVQDEPTPDPEPNPNPDPDPTPDPDPAPADPDPNADPAPDPTPDPSPDPAPSPDAKDFLTQFNTELKTEFKSSDDIRDLLEAKGKLETSSASEKQLKEDNKSLRDQYKKLVDPKESLGLSDNDYKRHLLLKENPELNGDVASKVFDTDLTAMPPIDLIVLNWMLDHPGINSGDAKEFVERKVLNLEEDYNTSDFTSIQKTDINISAQNAANRIAALKDKVVIPDFNKNIDELIGVDREAAKAEEIDYSLWENEIPALSDKVKAFEVKDGEDILYTEEVNKEFVEGIKEDIIAFVKENKMKPSEENLKQVTEEIQNAYKLTNLPAIMKRFKEQLTAKFEEAKHNDNHNDTDLAKDRERDPAIDTSRDTNMRDMVLGIR
jgi:hypothetical protein